MRWAVLALAVFVWGCGGAVAAEGPHYPPYPEVWGREMPWPSHVWEWQAPSVHERGNGEILIAFRDHEFPPTEPADDIEESGVLEFFGGTLTMGPDAFNAAIAYPQMTDDPFDRYATSARLSYNISVRSHETRTDEQGCFRAFSPDLFSVFRKQPSADPKVLKMKHIIAVLDRQHYRRIDFPSHCRSSDSAPPRAEPYMLRIVALRFFVHALRDGTFLAIGRERPVVIRLRSDLSSPFFGKTDRYFMIDYRTRFDIMRGFYDPVDIRDSFERYAETITSERKSK